MEKPEEKGMMSTQEVLEYLNISRSTLHRLRERGELHAHKFGKAVRFDRQEIDDFLRRTKQQ